MVLTRTNMLGGGAALAALGFIAWLAPTSWAITDCRELLQTAAFASPGVLKPDAPDVAVDLATRAAEGRLTEAETACTARIAPPF